MRKLGLFCLLLMLMTAGGAARTQELFRLPTPLGLDEYFPIPDDNPLTPEKIALGQRLFLDRRLSADRTIACASCHQPERAFSDDRPVAVGIGGQKGTRHAPALVNRCYGQPFFWDGRVPSLEEQALHPIQDPKEMNLKLDELTARLHAARAYREQFRRSFPNGISGPNVARSLASFVRSLRSGNAPYDQFEEGDSTALSTEARRPSPAHR